MATLVHQVEMATQELLVQLVPLVPQGAVVPLVQLDQLVQPVLLVPLEP